MPLHGASAEFPSGASASDTSETDIDTIRPQHPAARSRPSGSAPTWLVLAPTGQPRVSDPPTDIATVTAGSAFIRLLRELRPLLAVVSSPPAAARELRAAVAERERRPALRLILLNHPDDVIGRLEALALGFDEALPASIDPSELTGRARLLLGGGRPRPDAHRSITIARDVQLDLAARRVRRRGAEVHLRPREYDLLAMLATDPGRAFSRSELVDRIWGAAYVGGPRTIDVHIRWLRAKIEDNPARPVHVTTVRGVGYRLDLPEPDPGAPEPPEPEAPAPETETAAP